jgi:hypothetical protein
MQNISLEILEVILLGVGNKNTSLGVGAGHK